MRPLAVLAALAAGHAPFAWGRTPGEASHQAAVLESVARMAYFTEALHPSCEPVLQVLLDRHDPANMAQPRLMGRVEEGSTNT